MSQGNSNYRASSASKREERAGKHGKRAGAVKLDLEFLAKLRGHLSRPKSEMYASVIDAFEAHRKRRKV